MVANRIRLSLLMFPVGLLVASAPLLGQVRADTIRGRATTDSGKAVAAANVFVTMAPLRQVFQSQTDSAGNFQVVIPEGSGDYLLYVGAPGRKGFRRRLVRGESPFSAIEASLAPEVAAVLATVRVSAARGRPPRGDDATTTLGTAGGQLDGVAGAVSPDLMGNLEAGALLLPGLSAGANGGLSAFGLDGSASRFTLNGLGIDSPILPRDLPVRSRALTSSYDPTIGGFSGAMVAGEIVPGQVFTLASGHANLTPCCLWANPGTGQASRSASLSYARSGEFLPDAWVYSSALQVTGRGRSALGLEILDASSLSALGLSKDSVNRFLMVMPQGMRTGLPTQQMPDGSVSAAIRLDRAAATTFGGLVNDTKPRFGIVGLGNASRSSDPGSLLSATEARNVRQNASLSLQANGSRYLGKDQSYLVDVRSAVTGTTRRGGESSSLPSAITRVADGSEFASALRFGPLSGYRAQNMGRWESTEELSFNLTRDPRHRVKLFAQEEVSRLTAEDGGNSAGTFRYQSLADLQNNLPAEFSRSLVAAHAAGNRYGAAIAIADYWNKSPDLQLVFGPRVEVWDVSARTALGKFGTGKPGESLRGISVSPRIGFSWLYRGAAKAGRPQGGFTTSGIGSVYTPPRGVLRGGYGVFRSPVDIASTLASLRTPGVELDCVGGAVPIPDWPGMMNGGQAPSSCAGASVARRDSATNAELMSVGFGGQTRQTAALAWASRLKQVFVTIDVSGSRLSGVPSTQDLNFRGTPAFVLSAEGDRPVFVAANAIDPRTGLLVTRTARVDSSYVRVGERIADLRGEVFQSTVHLQPFLPQRASKWILGTAYTFSKSRTESRGFDGPTFEAPNLTRWYTGAMPTHQVKTQVAYRFTKPAITASSFWFLESGKRFTPMVGADVNGDGLANDVAYVFASSNSSRPDGWDQAIGSLPSSARDCLDKTIARAASVNRCEGPWTLQANARVEWNHRFGNPWRNAMVSLNVANPLTAVDHMLHGSSNLKGWGGGGALDPVLYSVQGFDTATSNFKYLANTRFGQPRGTNSAPFQVSLDVSITLTPNVQRQQVSYYLRPVRGSNERPPVDTILRRIRSGGGTAPDPYGWILANSDTLLLSNDQARDVIAAQRAYRTRLDSTWRSLATDLAGLPGDFDPERALARIQRANAESGNGPEGAVLQRILSPQQLGILPSAFRNLLPRTSSTPSAKTTSPRPP